MNAITDIAPAPVQASSGPAATSHLALNEPFLFRLYCGRHIPASVAQNSHRETLVREESIAKFIAKVLAPVFGDGFTSSLVQGGWKDQATGRCIIEPSVVFEVLTTDRAGIREVALAWKAWFHQDAVMILALPVVPEFV